MGELIESLQPPYEAEIVVSILQMGKLRPERWGTWWKVIQLGGSKGSTKMKTTGSQSEEMGDTLP